MRRSGGNYLGKQTTHRVAHQSGRWAKLGDESLHGPGVSIQLPIPCGGREPESGQIQRDGSPHIGKSRPHCVPVGHRPPETMDEHNDLTTTSIVAPVEKPGGCLDVAAHSLRVPVD